MKTYQSPEAVEIGMADQAILGSKLGLEFDAVDREYTQPVSTVLDHD